MNNLKIKEFPEKLAKKDAIKILSQSLGEQGKRMSTREMENFIKKSDEQTIKNFRRDFSYGHVDEHGLKKVVEAIQTEGNFKVTDSGQKKFDQGLKSHMPVEKTAPAPAKPTRRGLLSRIFNNSQTPSNKYHGMANQRRVDSQISTNGSLGTPPVPPAQPPARPKIPLQNIKLPK
ncbi:hypothetical protein ACFL1Y_00340 [Patescibacteria group bacterium]